MVTNCYVKEMSPYRDPWIPWKFTDEPITDPSKDAPTVGTPRKCATFCSPNDFVPPKGWRQ